MKKVMEGINNFFIDKFKGGNNKIEEKKENNINS
jgi:hypothetical protein